MNIINNFPVECPSCQTALTVTRLCCDRCETEVGGLYPLPKLCLLDSNDQAFILQFVKASGSLKEMAKHLKVSYPTVRNLLNDIIEKLESEETTEKND